MDRLDDGTLCAYDYTAIIRHKGRLFALGDISLAWLGGLSLPSMKMAFIITSPVAALAVLSWVTGWAVVWLTGGWLVLLIGAYVFFLLGGSDKDTPWNRAKLGGAGMLLQPSHIVDHRKDEEPDILMWSVIIQRPLGSTAAPAGRPLQVRACYRPTPKPGLDEFAVVDDYAAFASWEAMLAAAAASNGRL